MSPLELAADALILTGVGLAIAAASVIALPLGLAVGAIMCIALGAILTATALKRPPRTPGRPPGARGPFEDDTP